MSKPRVKATPRVQQFDDLMRDKEAKLAVLKLPDRPVTKVVADDPDFIPTYETPGAACCDLRADLPPDDKGERKLAIPPGAVVVIDVGFRMQLPEGYEAQIRARSGLATKGLTMANGIGTIDEDYRDGMKVIAANIGRQIIVIEHKQRIAQMALKAVERFTFDRVDELDPVPEGGRKGGLGSTGLK